MPSEKTRYQSPEDEEDILLAAFNGEKLPQSIRWLDKAKDYCIFATSPEVNKLCSKEGATSKLFARARNVRLIMSNIIPDMADDEKSYCIWYPDTATEVTYRALAQRYPGMRYHVGRACAVAGYSDLYNELQLLPDISIAEEAQDNAESGAVIFESLVGQDTRYAVIDDYTRIVSLTNPKSGVYLNGDTAIRSSLSVARDFKDNISNREHYFDIQEDRFISTEERPGIVRAALDDEHVHLLYSPLPKDLPTTNKDALVIMAAWEGNFERYMRLRRPRRVDGEISAVIRAAYNHTNFAKWLETCLDRVENFEEKERKSPPAGCLCTRHHEQRSLSHHLRHVWRSAACAFLVAGLAPTRTPSESWHGAVRIWLAKSQSPALLQTTKRCSPS
ncbi:hypothetical protein CCHL11_03870 [Colletotrichum chlorophyti]|uniref:Uncharacterized protein n=1 Tax=Colletotrichum chlorophyti TaxID=708187 RepID=A0A1Q8RQT4_9PEZI|nr:hypothetical protein CCHL11_03870 [Colletotrichum chlorophyti]